MQELNLLRGRREQTQSAKHEEVNDSHEHGQHECQQARLWTHWLFSKPPTWELNMTYATLLPVRVMQRTLSIFRVTVRAIQIRTQTRRAFKCTQNNNRFRHAFEHGHAYTHATTKGNLNQRKLYTSLVSVEFSPSNPKPGGQTRLDPHCKYFWCKFFGNFFDWLCKF